jgi:hypothetical protein
MCGPNPGYPGRLTEGEKKERERLLRVQATPHRLAPRAQIMLFASDYPGQSHPHLASANGTANRPARMWRGRWGQAHHLADAPCSGARPRHSHCLELVRAGPDAALALESAWC